MSGQTTRESRTLGSSPSILPLYARAAAPMLPGASLLPFIPGRGGGIPEIELELTGVRPQPADLAAYAKVCGFALRDQLPPTYPHVLAFPLHMAVMADGSFPFGAVGLVHLENRIEQRRGLGAGEELTIRVHPTPLRPHPKGRTFSLVTEVLADGEIAWESETVILRRGKGDSGATPSDAFAVSDPPRPELRTLPEGTPASAEWRLDGGLGRRYGAVSGDRNPIHMHSLTAKPLGFPAAIAHGMWTKARCLAALESRLPDAFGVDVRFRKPILLPSKVEFASAEQAGETLFAVRNSKREITHLDGRVRPVETNSQAQTERN
jgi:acyl dehydratase